MDQSDSLQRNLKILPVVYAFSGASFIVPIIVPFLRENGLDLHRIFLLQTFYAASLLIMEIPTGYLSDRWGRVNTAIAGSLLRLIGMLGYCMGHSFFAFAGAEIFLAIGASCHSGTLDALTYDTLASLKKTDSYRKVIGHQRSLFFGAEAVAAALAGVLAVINLRLAFGVTVVAFSCALVASFLLSEPDRHTMQQERHWDSIKRIAVTTAKSPVLRGVILLYSLIATLGLSLFWFTQPYQTEAGLPLLFFGIVHTCVVGAGAIASRFAYTFERFVSDRLLLLSIVLITTLGFVLLGSMVTLWMLPCFIVVRMAWSVVMPVTTDIGNSVIEARDRATVLSIKAFGHRLLFTCVAPLLGYMTGIIDLRLAILITGITGGALAALVLLCTWGIWNDR